MTRTVTDAARMLNVMVGFDPDDPITGRGVGKAPESFVAELGDGGMAGTRIGILRTVMGYHSEPDSDDFKAVDALFDGAVADLANAGAEIVDPVEIPGMLDLLAQRSADGQAEENSFAVYMAGSANAPFKTMNDARNHPKFGDAFHGVHARWAVDKNPEKFAAYCVAREELMTRFLKVLAENKLDAIVHKAVEHTPTPIADGTAPPWTDQKGAPHLNTFLIYVPSVVVPAGFTDGGLPAGITFLGRPYSDAAMLRLAYGYEQATGRIVCRIWGRGSETCPTAAGGLPQPPQQETVRNSTIRLAPEYAPGLAGSEAGGKALVLCRFIGPGVTWLKLPICGGMRDGEIQRDRGLD